MHILILGGTLFIGRHVAETLLAAGHRVTVFNRGQTPDALPAAVERLRGDRDLLRAGLATLEGRSFDACVDVSGLGGRQVRASAELLRGRVGRYLYVSAVAVYGDPAERPVRETHPTLDVLPEDTAIRDQETYGRVKATCERVVREVFPGAFTIFRPQTVVGPHDPTGRYAYWIRRASLGPGMLAPGDGTDHLQVVDVRDLAGFARTALERGLGGEFNLAGPRVPWREFIGWIGAVGPVWVPADILAAAKLTFNDLPLYRPERGERASLMDVSAERARAAGLALTPPEASVRDFREWLAGRDVELMLPPEREAELIRQAKERT